MYVGLMSIVAAEVAIISMAMDSLVQHYSAMLIIFLRIDKRQVSSICQALNDSATGCQFYFFAHLKTLSFLVTLEPYCLLSC